MRTSAFPFVWVTSHWNEVSRELFPRHNHAVVCRSPAMQAQQRHQPDGFPTPFLADSINAAPSISKAGVHSITITGNGTFRGVQAGKRPAWARHRVLQGADHPGGAVGGPARGRGMGVPGAVVLGGRRLLPGVLRGLDSEGRGPVSGGSGVRGCRCWRAILQSPQMGPPFCCSPSPLTVATDACATLYREADTVSISSRTHVHLSCCEAPQQLIDKA